MSLIKNFDIYDLVNKVVPGGLFGFLVSQIRPEYSTLFQQTNSLLLFYFAGDIFSRIGSLLFDRIIKKIIPYVEYSKFVLAEKKDEKISVFMREVNTFRTYLIILPMYIIRSIASNQYAYTYILFIVLLVVLVEIADKVILIKKRIRCTKIKVKIETGRLEKLLKIEY